jgi:hypothetical protein
MSRRLSLPSTAARMSRGSTSQLALMEPAEAAAGEGPAAAGQEELDAPAGSEGNHKGALVNMSPCSIE